MSGALSLTVVPALQAQMLYRLWAASGSNDMAAAYYNAWTAFVPRKGGEE